MRSACFGVLLGKRRLHAKNLDPKTYCGRELSLWKIGDDFCFCSSGLSGFGILAPGFLPSLITFGLMLKIYLSFSLYFTVLRIGENGVVSGKRDSLLVRVLAH